MHVLAIVNQKGGVGKTNTVANVGAALSARGRRVVAIDADPQATLTKMLLPSARDEAGTAAVFGDEPPATEALLVDISAFGVRLMPSDFDRLEEMQSTLMRDPTRLFGLSQAIVQLDGRVDYVLIVRTLRRVERVNRVPIEAVVATAYKSGNTFHPEIVAGVRAALTDTPLFTVRDAIDVQRAVSKNMPIRLFSPKNGASADYDALAEALDEKLIGAVEAAHV
jgi:cellulose biosynthesis protein BcsQ